MAGGAWATGGGSDATVAIGGASAAAAGVSFADGAAPGDSDAGTPFGEASGLISILACFASVSDVGGKISFAC